MTRPIAEGQHPVTIILKEMRETLNMTQVQIAKRLGVSLGTIGQYEAGKTVNPSWDFLARMVVRLGVDPRRFFPDHSEWPEESPEGDRAA